MTPGNISSSHCDCEKMITWRKINVFILYNMCSAGLLFYISISFSIHGLKTLRTTNLGHTSSDWSEPRGTGLWQGCIDGWIDGLMDGLIDGRMDGYLPEYWADDVYHPDCGTTITKRHESTQLLRQCPPPSPLLLLLSSAHTPTIFQSLWWCFELLYKTGPRPEIAPALHHRHVLYLPFMKNAVPRHRGPR